MLLNSFGTRVSGHREHKKAFRSTIFTFKMCGNHHLKKLGGKTLRWLNFARVHPSVKKRDLQGRAGAAEVTWSALSSALSAGTAGGGRERGGGRGRCVTQEEPVGVNRFGPSLWQCGFVSLDVSVDFPSSRLLSAGDTLARSFCRSWRTHGYFQNHNFTK